MPACKQLENAPTLAACVAWMFELYRDARHVGTWREEKQDFQWATYGEVGDEAEALAAGLATLVNRRDAVGIMMANCKEWLVADFACALNDSIVVGVHGDWSQDKLDTIFADLSIPVVLVDSASALRKLANLAAPPKIAVSRIPPKELPSDAELQGIHVVGYGEVLSLGRRRKTLTASGRGPALTHVDEDDDPDAMFTLMYSSGTGGKPKAVATPKGTWRKTNCNPGPLGSISTPSDRRAVSYLSLAHGADRGVCWFTSMSGGSVAVVTEPESTEGFFTQLRTAKPTFFLAMSCTWQDLYLQYLHDLDPAVDAELLHRVRGDLSHCVWEREGMRPGELRAKKDMAALASAVDHDNHPLWLKLRAALLRTRAGHAVANNVMNGIRDKLGGSLLIAVTGGAKTPKDVIHFITGCLTEGNECRAIDSYGSTEFPGISSNGEVSSDVEMKLIAVERGGRVLYSPDDAPSPRGEIVVRRKDGHRTSYFQRPHLSNWSSDGWYHTGDIGRLTAQNKLEIIDRVTFLEELYYRGDSVWIEPTQLEEAFVAASPNFLQCLVVADRNREGIAIVVVIGGQNEPFDLDGVSPRRGDPGYRRGYPAVSSTCYAEVVDVLVERAKTLALKPYEHPIGVIVETDAWSREEGLITLLGKPNRAKVKEVYAEAIGRSYSIFDRYKDAKPPPTKEDVAGTTEPGADSPGQTPKTPPICFGDDWDCHMAPGLRRELHALLDALEHSAATVEYSTAQVHHSSLTKTPLPAVAKGSRLLDLTFRSAATGELARVDTARGRDWIDGSEKLDFRAVAERDGTVTPAAKPPCAGNRVSVLHVAEVDEGLGFDDFLATRATSTVENFAVNTYEDSRQRRFRVAMALNVPLHAVRWVVTDRANLDTKVGVVDAARGGEPNGVREAGGAARPPGTCCYPLEPGESRALRDRFECLVTKALVIRSDYAGWAVAEEADRAAAAQRLRDVEARMDSDVLRAEQSQRWLSFLQPDQRRAEPGHKDPLALPGPAIPPEMYADAVDGTIAILDRLLRCKLEVLACKEAEKRIRPCPEALDAWDALDKEMVLLRLLGDALDVDTRGLPVTWRLNIDWVLTAPAEDATQCILGCGRMILNDLLAEHTNDFAGPCDMSIGVIDDHSTNVGGDQTVTCDVTGITIDDETFETMTTGFEPLPYRNPRVHSVTAHLDRSPEYHQLVQRAWQVSEVFEAEWRRRGAGAAGWAARSQRLRGLLRVIDRHRDELWVREKQHVFWELKYVCVGKDIGEFDTPASLLVRACDAFAERPALGISNRKIDRPRLTKLTALADAAGLSAELLTFKNFTWLQYRTLWKLVRSVASGLRKLIPPNSFVAIAGYNEFDWVIADLACTICGYATVGLHTTYDLRHASAVVNLCRASALLSMANLFSDAEQKNRWTVPSLVEICPSLKCVIVLDAETTHPAVAPFCERMEADYWPRNAIQRCDSSSSLLIDDPLLFVVQDVHDHEATVKVHGPGYPVQSIAYSAKIDGSSSKVIATGLSDNTIRLWSSRTGEELSCLEIRTATPSCLCFSPCSRFLAAGLDVGDVEVYDVHSLEPARTLTGHSADVLCVKFSAAGGHLATGSADGSARVWDLAKKSQTVVVIAHGGEVPSVCFSPDDAFVATASADGYLRVCDAKSGVELGKVVAHEAGVSSVAWCRKTGGVYSSGKDGFVRRWIVDDTGRGLTQEWASQWNAKEVMTVAASPDGKSAAAVSRDGTVRILSAATGKSTTVWLQQRLDPFGVDFSPCGNRVTFAVVEGYDSPFNTFPRASSSDANMYATTPMLGSLGTPGKSSASKREVVTGSFISFVKQPAQQPPEDVNYFKVEGVPYRGERLMTLLPTSGSSGVPKLVAVSCRSFVYDIAGDREERMAVSQSMTISYIPLSHSSDRYKLWQHLALGGSVALCFYAAHHWQAHEQSKKDAVLRYTSPVQGLFDQVSDASPTSMSCPPNIWAGLYEMFYALPPEQQDLRKFARSVLGSRIENLATGGSPTPGHHRKFAEELCREVHCSFVDSYGATECGAIMSNGRMDGSKYEEVEVLILDRPDIGFVKDGPRPRGELAVQSPSIAIGYLNDPEREQVAFVDVGNDGVFVHPGLPSVEQPKASPGKWYVTGDVIEQKANGSFVLLDRVSAIKATKSGAIISEGKLETMLEELAVVQQAFVSVSPLREQVLIVLVPASATQMEDAVPKSLTLVPADPRPDYLLQDPKWADIEAYLEGLRCLIATTKGYWVTSNGYLSGELKKMRHVISSKYAMLADGLGLS